MSQAVCGNEQLAVSRRDQVSGVSLDEETARQAMATVADRNLSVHTYRKALAEELFSRLSAHTRLFQTWYEALQQRATESELPSNE